MPAIRHASKLKPPPDGFSEIEDDLLIFSNKMKDTQNTPTNNIPKHQAQRPIFKISHQRSRYIYELYCKESISKKLYDWLLKNGYADAMLIAKWKKQGYENLCCLRCIQTKETNFASTCICRVSRAQLKENQDIQCYEAHLCTWSIIVPNVPEQFKEVPGTWFKSWLRELGKLSYPAIIKVAWMLYTIVLPEYVLGKALSGFMCARHQAAGQKEVIEGGETTAAESFKQQIELWTTSHTMLADLGGFVVDFRNLSLPAPPDQDQENAPVLDKTEDDRQIQGKKVKRHRNVPASGGEKKAGESTTHDVGISSHSSPGQNSPCREETDLVDESTTQDPQGQTSTRPENTEVNKSESLRNSVEIEQNTPSPEDPTLTHFVLYLEKSFRFLGGFDWEPRPDHRQILNLLALEGHMGDWTSTKFEKWAKSPFYALCGDKWVLNAKQMWLAANMGLIDLPTVSERQIQDKSKSNSLVTTLALFQIAQLVAALGSRFADGIPVSQLETVALAYAVCAVFTYALQWSCPKDVGVPVTTQALRRASREDIIAIGREGRARWWWGGMFISYTIPYMCTPHYSAYHDVGTLIGLSIFGAFHLIAWAFAFPTAGERLAWQVASIATAVIPLLILAVMVLVMRLSSNRRQPDFWDSKLRFLSVWPMAAISFVFVSVRIFMMIETFRSLYFLPPDGYIATRSDNMPSYE